MRISSLTKRDFSIALETLVEAFMDDGLYVHACPEEAARRAFLESFFALRLRYGLKFGQVLAAENCKAIAIVLPPDSSGMPPSKFLRAGGLRWMLSTPSVPRECMMEVMKASEASTSGQQPYWTVAPVAVRASERGKGLGTALMRHVMLDVEAKESRLLLETQSERNVDFYKRLGFGLLGSTDLFGGALRHYVLMA